MFDGSSRKVLGFVTGIGGRVEEKKRD